MQRSRAPGRRPGKEASPSRTRCFVALQPDEAALDRLDRLAGEEHARFPSARRVRRENLHLTLAFIGALEADRARLVAAALAGQTATPFDWLLDSVGAFAGARVLWVGGADAQLEALAARARALLDELAVRFDRKPFVAHVTLLRDLPRAARYFEELGGDESAGIVAGHYLSAGAAAEGDDLLQHLAAPAFQRIPADRLLRQALMDFDRAAIFTIHGFCQRVLYENAFETASAFNAELLQDQTPILAEVVEDFWRRTVCGQPPEFLRFAGFPIDRILAKVHEQGLLSLTHREKKALARVTRPQQEHDSSAGRADRL